MSNPQVEANDDELTTEEERYPLCELLYDNVARMATTWLGQIVYRRVDYLFSVAEKTARWSMPQSSNPGAAENSSAGKRNFSAPPLVRPLPWILFLPALLAMRLMRTALSLVALLIGKQPVYPWTVVTFLQKTHRKLRALKYRGQKLRRISTAEREAAEELQNSWLKRVFVTLRAVVLIRPTGVQAVVCQQNHHQCQQRSASKRTAKERDDGDSEISVEEGTVGDLLDKYANYEGDSAYSAEEASEDQSGTSESESEESTLAEETPKKSAKNKQNGKKEEKTPKEQKSDEPSKQQRADEPSKPKASNGDSAQDKSEQKRKSSLNVENTKSEEGKSTTSTDADAPEHEKNSVNSANRSKSATFLENERAENNSSGTTSKSTPNLAPSEGESAKQSPNAQDEQQKEGMKNGHQNGSKSQPAAGHDAKGNPAKDQRSKQPQQHPQQHHQQQHHQQSHQHQQQHHQQQSQHTTANGAGGGTKKQKRPSQTYF